ncbi:hypothetical protein HYDPIDRAFT_27997 [Hydnomerulius pinastri MD-312]|uniref:DUF6533 domain-containing protein n=1 Tax=Hydnomerulius pinastri MD-312 TaxID=994086 RepID=A0A0C9WFZ3_9AGAM|nr:hypothetical protein HYDPIDRAFT_27997 [Hydnomerulius pinastri MD-312]
MSDPEQELESWLLFLQQLELCQIAGVTVLFYDYRKLDVVIYLAGLCVNTRLKVLTFSLEVDLIWRKPWSLVSLLYVVVGFVSVMNSGQTKVYIPPGPLSELLTVNCNLYERSSFVRKRVRATPVYILLNGSIVTPVHWFYRCLMVYEIRVWGLFVYRIAMDAIMIKRVYAMYHGSRSILILLVSCCIAKTMAVLILLMLSIGPMSGLQYLEGNIDSTFICSTQPKVGLMVPSSIPPLCFEVLLFVLVARCFLIHALERRRQWNRWKLNDLVRIMARDSTIYFILILATIALNARNWKQTENFYGAFSASLVTSIPFILVPRLVVNFKDYFEHADRVHVCSGDAGNLADSDPPLGDHSLLVFRTERDSVGCSSTP